MQKDRSDYFREYSKNNLRRLSLNLSKMKDKDILDAIESEGKGNIQAGVKSLIRKGIAYNKDPKTIYC